MSATRTLDDEGPERTPEPPPAPPKRRRRWPFVLGAFVAVGAVFAYFFPAILGYLAKEQARAHGVLLEFDTVTLTSRGVDFDRATLRLVGVRGVTWTTRDLDVHVAGLEPEALLAKDVDVALEGSITDLTVDLAAWTATYPASLGVPFSAERLAGRWASAAGAAPWLELGGGTLLTRGKTTVLRASSLSLSGLPLGGTSAVWTGSDARAEIGVGAEDLARAPIRFVLGGELGKRSAELSVSLLRASDLVAAFGIDLPPTKAAVEGKAQLVLPANLDKDPIAGTLTFDIEGFTLPHPRELSGIVYGDHTRVTSRFEVSGDRRTIQLRDTQVEAGALRASGDGTIQRAGTYATAALSLKGTIACSLVSRSLGSNSGLGELGKLLGDLAGQAVSGSVAFTVKVDADTRDVRALKLTPSFGVGCGLRLP